MNKLDEYIESTIQLSNEEIEKELKIDLSNICINDILIS